MLRPKEGKLLGPMLSPTSKGDETPSSLGPDKTSFVLGLTYAEGLGCQTISQTGFPPLLASTSPGPLPGLPHARVSALRQLGPPKHQAKRIIIDSELTMATCRGVARRRSSSQ